MLSHSKIIFCVITFHYILRFSPVHCISALEDLTMSSKEKKSLDELKRRVFDILPNDYMKQEVYLINWIRAGEGNVDKAEQLLKENLKWRKEYRMDRILQEDFPRMEEEFPIDLDGVDYEGRPILLVHIGDWDVRKSHLIGLHDENYRYSMQSLERASQKVRDAQAQGKEVTRFNIIFDFSGFNMRQHGCAECLPPYLNFVIAFQKYFPGLINEILFINVPQSWEAIVRLLRPVARTSLRKTLKIYGTNRREWQKHLFKLVPRNQIDVSLGGTKP